MKKVQKWIDPPVNPGKKSYKEYLEAEYGSEAKRMLFRARMQNFTYSRKTKDPGSESGAPRIL